MLQRTLILTKTTNMSLIEYKGKYAAFTLVDSFQILIVLCVVCIGVLLLRLQMRSKEG